MKTPSPTPLPASGGSYVVDAKGKLVRREFTRGPRDPEHELRRKAADQTSEAEDK